jgi:DnaK suppressor protein
MAQGTGSATTRTDIDLEHFRKRLQEEKASVENIIHANMNREADGGMSVSPADDDDTRSTQAGSELAMRAQDEALVANARKILSRIERAMAKLDEGTYGLSDVSGKPIPVERLEVLPYATLTAAEQEKHEG